MGLFLLAESDELVKSEVNRTTKKFLEYYVSALESLHYIALDFNRMDYEDRERKRIEKAKADRPLTSKESDGLIKRAYNHIRLEDLFKPDGWSTRFIKLFDEVKLPYFDHSGKLTHRSPNSLLHETYDSLYTVYGFSRFGFPDRLEETIIVKGNALIKKAKSKADYSNGLIHEELERLTNKMMEYFLSRTAILYSEYTDLMTNPKPSISREYFSAFSKMKIPVLEDVLINIGDRFLKTKKQYLKLSDAIDKKVSNLGYNPHALSYTEEEIRRLSWLVGQYFAKETLNKLTS